MAKIAVERLDTVAPDITKLLRSASSARSCAAGVAAARFALNVTGVREAVIDETLLALEQGASVQLLVPQLEQLVDRYDDTYFQFDAKGDKGAALKWFSQARALSALVYAAKSEPLEACYESQAATDDIVGWRKVIHEALGRQGVI